MQHSLLLLHPSIGHADYQVCSGVQEQFLQVFFPNITCLISFGVLAGNLAAQFAPPPPRGHRCAWLCVVASGSERRKDASIQIPSDILAYDETFQQNPLRSAAEHCPDTQMVDA
jgi:hypothetical protein